MARRTHVLSVGNDPVLMTSRSLILSGAGYLVDEAYTIREAIRLVASDSVDVMIICHTIDTEDQRFLISETREKRRLLPILYLQRFVEKTIPANCTPVDNNPEALLHALRQAIQIPKRD